MIDRQKKEQEYQRVFGLNSVKSGRFIRPLDVVPTGVLALDYALGTGGWPSGSLVEIFGLEDVGKSLLALNGVREAQKLGKFCGWVAAEPGYDALWAEKHGVDPERMMVTLPNDGLDAFNQLHKMVLDEDIGFIVFDSIGALLRPSEVESQSGFSQPSAAGQAALITWGVKRSWMAAYKLNKFVIFINQARDILNSRYGGIESPGGHALKHGSEIRIRLRATEKHDIKTGDENITIGRTVIAEIIRTKRNEGSGKRAVYKSYTMEVEGYPFGIDRAYDVINTGKRTNIITQSGAWLYYEDFPGGKLHGQEAVAKWLAANPEAITKIQKRVVEAIR